MEEWLCRMLEVKLKINQSIIIIVYVLLECFKILKIIIEPLITYILAGNFCAVHYTADIHNAI